MRRQREIHPADCLMEYMKQSVEGDEVELRIGEIIVDEKGERFESSVPREVFILVLKPRIIVDK